MSDARLDDIEIRYAFQEDTIRQLDEVVRELGDQLASLQRQVQELRAQMAQQGDGGPGSPADEVPPHY